VAAGEYGSVEDYIAAQPESVRASLHEVRTAIRKAIPEAEEFISYGIPAYRLPQGVVIWFAGWKRHYSLYPATDCIVSALSEELAPYEVEKGTIRFPLDARVPVALIGRIARLRAEEVAAKAKAAASRRRGTRS
jgi:uncharacterized protein YdhG (YjbR/CyaY superfamily)